jgi:hypothetical protein
MNAAIFEEFSIPTEVIFPVMNCTSVPLVSVTFEHIATESDSSYGRGAAKFSKEK